MLLESEAIQNKTGWIILYSLLAFIFLLLFIVYLICILPDLRTLTPKLPGYKGSQIMYIITLFLRFAGYLVWACLLGIDKTQSKLSAIFCGIPGYFMSAVYILMFFLWCSISANLLLNDSSISKIALWSFIVNATILALGVLLIIFIFALKEDAFHASEVWIAVARDIICGILILYFCIDIFKKLKYALGNSKSVGLKFLKMSIVLIVALVIRAVSTILYYYVFGATSKDNYHGIGSLLNTAIGQLLAEVIPCIMISANRKRSGLLSVYDEIT